MQEAFQYGYESVYGEDKEQLLPDKDIDEDLSNKNSYAYEMIGNDEIIKFKVQKENFKVQNLHFELD